MSAANRVVYIANGNVDRMILYITGHDRHGGLIAAQYDWADCGMQCRRVVIINLSLYAN